MLGIAQRRRRKLAEDVVGGQLACFDLQSAARIAQARRQRRRAVTGRQRREGCNQLLHRAGFQIARHDEQAVAAGEEAADVSAQPRCIELAHRSLGTARVRGIRMSGIDVPARQLAERAVGAVERLADLEQHLLAHDVEIGAVEPRILDQIGEEIPSGGQVAFEAAQIEHRRVVPGSQRRRCPGARVAFRSVFG